jgi:hypothetical protein
MNVNFTTASGDSLNSPHIFVLIDKLDFFDATSRPA